MSAIPSVAPAPRRADRPRTRRLRPAPAPDASGRHRPRLVYAVVAVAVVLGVAAAQLVLGIALAQGAYDLDALQAQKVELGRQQASLAEEVVRAESPQFLAANAEALGMVPNANPVYLRLSDGSVLGAPQAAQGGAVGSTALVPNELVTGMPLVTEQGGPAGGQETPSAPPADTAVDPARAAEGGSTAGGADVPVAPPTVDGLPTPATH